MDSVCDGADHCAYGDNEGHHLCNWNICIYRRRLFCDNYRRCINTFDVCDGINDCDSGEDESSRSCSLIQHCTITLYSLSGGCIGRCKPGFFGNYCEKNCSETCLNRICNVQSGFCTNCPPGYYGKYCYKNCSNQCLKGICNYSSGICKDCTTGYYGKYCDKTCPKECLNGTCNTSSGICQECAPGYFGTFCEKSCSNECFNGICNSPSGICKECKPGYFGKYCERNCSEVCLNWICNSSSGMCKDCTPGYFGKYCERNCSEDCLNGICHSSSGICKDCKPGYFGKFCERKCSEECLNGICNSSSGICKDCTRTYLESCSLRCGQGCRQRNGFPQCDRQSGKCLHGCYLTYGSYCNETCSKCKRPSSVVPCDTDGVCLLGCESDYWDKKCSSKCSANCQGDEHGNRCNPSTGECINGCTHGWSGRLCGVATMIVISAILTVVFVVVGSVCFLLARKGFVRQQNNRMEPGSVFPDGVPPTQQPSWSRRRHSSNMNVYADINGETMENYHYICEQNSPDQYDEINVTNYDRDIEIVPSKEFTDESISGRSVAKSEGKNVFDSTEETVRGVTQFNGDLDQVCKSDSTSGVNTKRSDIKSNSFIELVGTKDVFDLEAHCQTTKAENRQLQAAKYCNEGEDTNEETMDYYHYICEQNSPDHYDEINVTNYDRDTEIVPSREFTDESISGRSVAKSEGKNVLDSTEETSRGVTQFNGDLDHVCKSDSTSGFNPKRSDTKSNSSNKLVSTNDVLALEAHCQTNKAESRQLQAAKYCNESENIFGDLGQFQVDYIHAIASEECELLDNELDHQTVESSL